MLLFGFVPSTWSYWSFWLFIELWRNFKYFLCGLWIFRIITALFKEIYGKLRIIKEFYGFLMSLRGG